MGSSIPHAASPKEVVTPYVEVEDDIAKHISPSMSNHVRIDGLSAQRSVLEERGVPMVAVRRRKRTSTCPPWAGKSLVSGPWSMEWLSDQVHHNAGIVSSSIKKGKQIVVSKDAQPSNGVTIFKRKKVGGVLHHSILSLEKGCETT